MVGTFTSPAFAQQFKEPDYEINGGKVLGFGLDPETATLTILIDPRGKGELTITLPRNLIDAKTGSQDTDFIVIIDGLEYHFFDETTTSSDRTVTIPFGRFNSEITIMGTQVFSQVTTAPAAWSMFCRANLFADGRLLSFCITPRHSCSTISFLIVAISFLQR